MISKGQRIGVFAPSSYVERADIEVACAFIKDHGFEVFVHPQTYARDGQMAGTAQDKIAALHALYLDQSVDIIWAAGGGNRALQMLDGLDYDVIRANPKPMIGFSDVTALLNAISAQTDIINIHGPVFKNIPQHKEIDVLMRSDFSVDLRDANIIHDGHATGRVFGGNLSVFQYLPQTIDGDWLKGVILFLEDCGEELSRIDRMFIHLKRMSVLDNIGGLMLGEFSDLGDTGRPFGFSFEDVIRTHLSGADIPVIMNAPFGHGAKLSPIAVGAEATLDTAKRRLVLI